MDAGREAGLLTDAEIAELRKEVDHFESSAAPLESYDVEGAYAALPRLLDEVEHTREIRRAVRACPPEHGMEHAAYCGGCCAKFDPGRMVLVHAADCKFRGHERAER